jgi:hypothetical protein
MPPTILISPATGVSIRPLPIRPRLPGGLAATGLGGKPTTASRKLDIELFCGSAKYRTKR